MAKIFKLDFSYLVGFSLIVFIVYGLLINTLLSLLGVTTPLSLVYVWPLYSVLFLLFGKIIIDLLSWKSINLSTLALRCLFILNPLIAVAGVYYLDNTSLAAIAIFSTILVSVIFLLTLFFVHKDKITYSLSLYSSAISLILANSFRSRYLVGWDIHQEFLVFRLTNHFNYWNIKVFKDAYNACLSITIFPTLVHNLTGLDPLVIFKVVIPLLIGIIPIIVFNIGSKLTTSRLAYVGAFSFLIQNQFFAQLPALLRQGIAFIFFALMIDVVLNKKASSLRQQFLFMTFGIGMILSHYSTTYVALLVFLMAKVISVIFNKLFPCRSRSGSLSYISILILFIITFFWNVLITDTAVGLSQVFSKVAANIGQTFSLENKSDMVKGVFYQSSSNTHAVEQYYANSLKITNHPEQFLDYPIKPINLDTGIPVKITSPIPLYFHIIIPWLFRLSIVVGSIYLFFWQLKHRQTPVVVGFGIAMYLVIFGIILLPNLSSNYNFERLFQQMLVLLSPVAAVGLGLFVKRFKRIGTVFISLLFISFLFQSTGLIDHLIYHSKFWMYDNSGEQYYRYYTTSSEVNGMDWLSTHSDPNILLFTDKYIKLRLMAYSSQKFGYISSQINPPALNNYSYIFTGLAGNQAGAVFAEAEDKALEFTLPSVYLNRTYNNIYTNSYTKIYR